MPPELTLFISVAGIVYSVTVAFYSMSDVEIKSMDSVYRQAFDDFFVLLNAGISIVAWLLFLSTAGTTTPLVAGLFILAEAVFILKELINLALFCWYETASFNRDTRPDIQRHKACLAIEVEAHVKTAWVGLVSAIGLTVIIAGWCMAPESLVVGGLSLIAMGHIYWERHDVIERIDAEMALALQAVVDDLTPWWMNRNESTVQVDLMASNEGLRNMDRCEDWHHRDAPVSGRASQEGLFSRKSDDRRAENEPYTSDNKRSHQSAMMS